MVKIKNITDFEYLFRKKSKKIWRNDILNKVNFKFSISNVPKTYASVNWKATAKPKAYGNSLYSVAKDIEVKVKPAFFDLPKKHQKKILIHEIGHIGYPQHNKEFREFVNKFGGTISVNALTKKYLVQVKEGSRYVTIKEIENFDEAFKYGTMLNKLEKKRVRILE